MSTITANGGVVALASITIPYYGTWTADLVLPVGASISSPVTIVVGDMTLVGTAVRQAEFNGDLSVRVVGGAGGWRRELPARGYSHIIGVRLSTLLADAASESGETIVVDSDRSVGTLWARERAKGESLLRFLLDGHWWVDSAGVTQTKARTSSTITSPFTVINRDGSKGSYEIATENLSAWQPGRTFQAKTMAASKTISSVTIDAGNDGKLRLRVLDTDGTNERLRTDIRSIMRAEVPTMSYAGTWEYTIAPSPLALGLVSTVDCTPTDSRMPSLTNVPLVGMGVVAAPVTGTRCRIQFVNEDPSRPECVSLASTSEHVMTLEATLLLLYNFFYAMSLVAPAPAGMGILIQPLITPALLAACAASSIPAPPGLIAQIATAAAASAGMVAGTAPSNTIGPLAAAVSALSTKMQDVSGLFPGVGIPNG
jgi:hypothetical protein